MDRRSSLGHDPKVSRGRLRSFPDESLVRHWEREIRAFEDGIERARKRTEVLLLELGEECRRVLKLLAQLEISTLTEAQREAVLGELSAAVLHLHEHTRGLDSVIDDKA